MQIPFTTITEQEQVCIEKTVELWNELVKLPAENINEFNEFMFHIHAIQNAIASRPMFRIINKK